MAHQHFHSSASANIILHTHI